MQKISPKQIETLSETLSEINDRISAIEGGGSADLDSPAFTGTPTAPTAAPGTNTTQLATTAFVYDAVTGLLTASEAAATYATSSQVSDLLAGKAPLASPAFTGTPSAPTAAPGTNTTQLATTGFVAAALGSYAKPDDITTALSGYLTSALAASTYAPLASPALTGNPTAPTQTSGNNSTRLATTAFVANAVSGFLNSTDASSIYFTIADAANKANIASPAFTGTPTAPTATAGTNTTQIATTAFVAVALSEAGGGSATPGWVVAATGTGSSMNITLPEAILAENIFVFVNGLRQSPLTGYTVTGTTLAITAPTNANIVVEKPSGNPGADGKDAIGIADAPVDGKQYARKDASWVEVTASGGGGEGSGWVEIATISLVGQTTVEFSNIPQTYSDLYLLMDNVKHNHTSNAMPTLAVQRSAVPTWWRSFNLFALGYANTQIIAGDIQFPLYKQHASLIHSNMVIVPAAAPYTATNNAANLKWTLAFKDAGAITGLRIAMSGGAFETGTVTLYGRS